MNFGATEIILIIAVIVLFFGAKKIPELARGLGEGFNEFRKVSDDSKDDIKTDEKDETDEINEGSSRNKP